MPSRDEIVAWLREAGKDAEQTMPFANEPWEKIAAQVEAMRCETCKYYDKQHQLCEVVGGSELLIPVYFGCFSHEPKEGV